jgi:hypothetical protein
MTIEPDQKIASNGHFGRWPVLMENTDVLFIYGQFVIGAPFIPFPLKIAKFHY